MTKNMTRMVIEKDYLHFSAAHFTLFSDTERENLHGHNYHVRCIVEAPVGRDGLCFDYSTLKDALLECCNELDEFMLLPTLSPWLSISEEADGNLVVQFASERLMFLKRDVKQVEVANITIEALADWFLKRLVSNAAIADLPIATLTIGISSGSGQWAEAIHNDSKTF